MRLAESNSITDANAHEITSTLVKTKRYCLSVTTLENVERRTGEGNALGDRRDGRAPPPARPPRR